MSKKEAAKDFLTQGSSADRFSQSPEADVLILTKLIDNRGKLFFRKFDGIALHAARAPGLFDQDRDVFTPHPDPIEARDPHSGACLFHPCNALPRIRSRVVREDSRDLCVARERWRVGAPAGEGGDVCLHHDGQKPCADGPMRGIEHASKRGRETVNRPQAGVCQGEA